MAAIAAIAAITAIDAIVAIAAAAAMAVERVTSHICSKLGGPSRRVSYESLLAPVLVLPFRLDLGIPTLGTHEYSRCSGTVLVPVSALQPDYMSVGISCAIWCPLWGWLGERRQDLECSRVWPHGVFSLGF